MSLYRTKPVYVEALPYEGGGMFVVPLNAKGEALAGASGWDQAEFVAHYDPVRRLPKRAPNKLRVRRARKPAETDSININEVEE